MSLMEYLDDALRSGDGNVFVVEEAVRGTVPDLVRRLAPTRVVTVVDMDVLHPPDAHDALATGATEGTIVLATAGKRFPYNMAHVAYIWLKGDGLVQPTTQVTTRDLPGGCILVVCVCLDAWRTVPLEMQTRLIGALSGGGHWFESGTMFRESLAGIEIRRRKSLLDPFEALRNSGGADERRRLVLMFFPPEDDPHAEGFEGHDEAILRLMDKIDSARDDDLARDLLTVFAAQTDIFLSKEALKRGWPCTQEAEATLAESVVSRGYLGGQKAPFWDLVSELVQLGNDQVRAWLAHIVRSPSSDGFASGLYVAGDVRLWPDLVDALVEASKTAADAADQDLIRVALKPADLSSIPLDARYRLRLGMSDAAYFLEVAQQYIAAEHDNRPVRDIEKLAELHARIQSIATTYQKSLRTLFRAVDILASTGSIDRAADLGYLTSLRPHTPEYDATCTLIAEMRGGES